jgi:hypothetical protein
MKIHLLFWLSVLQVLLMELCEESRVKCITLEIKLTIQMVFEL